MECAERELDVFDRFLIAVCKFVLKPLGAVVPSIDCLFFNPLNAAMLLMFPSNLWTYPKGWVLLRFVARILTQNKLEQKMAYFSAQFLPFVCLWMKYSYSHYQKNQSKQTFLLRLFQKCVAFDWPFQEVPNWSRKSTFVSVFSVAVWITAWLFTLIIYLD